MSRSRVVVLADSHLSPRVTATQDNWAAALRHIETRQPDLVVHVGDLSMDGTHDADHLAYGRAQMDAVPVPWRVIPGNHDIGDTPSTHVEPDDVVNAARVARWCDTFGPDRWAVDLGRWRLVGLNAQLFGSGQAREAEQWDFIEDALRDARRAGQRLLLIIHKPIAASTSELADAPPYRFVASPSRDRLWDRTRNAGAEAVLSGHVHQARAFQVDGVTQLWAPTTWAVLPEDMQRTIGTKQCGLLELELPDDGPLVHEFVVPDGTTQHQISPDLPYPPPR
jgi:3',5'-cyclic AMP phosphodiesterase CpdA